MKRGSKQGRAREKSPCRAKAGLESQGQSGSCPGRLRPLVLMETGAMLSSVAVFSAHF